MKQRLIKAILRFLWLRYPRIYMETALSKEKYHLAKNPPKGKKKPPVSYPGVGE